LQSPSFGQGVVSLVYATLLGTRRLIIALVASCTEIIPTRT